MKDIDKELEGMALEQDQKFDKKIQKMIDRRMRRNALKVIGIVVLIAVVIFLGLSPLINLFQTNPAKANKGTNSTLVKTLRAYYETTHPYMEVADIIVTKNGFGCYTLNIDVIDHREYIAIKSGDPQNTIAKMKLGKLTITSDPQGRSTPILGAFGDNNEKYWTSKDKEEVLSEISKLPDSAHLYVSVQSKSLVDVSKLLALRNNGFNIEWLQIYQKNSRWQPGVSANVVANLEGKDATGREGISAKYLRLIYIDNLQTMYDHQKLYAGFQLYSGDQIYEQGSGVLKEALDAAKKNAKFQTSDYCISGTKAEVLKYLNEGNFSYINVDKVRYSMLGN